MDYLLAKLDYVLKDISGAKHLLLLLDYDGTLVPIVETPDMAVMPEELRKLLKSLAGSPDLTLGIISGRSLNEIRDLVGINHIFYSGNHGLELQYPDCKVEVFYSEQMVKDIQGIKLKLEQKLAKVEGMLLETKGPILAVHYRRCNPEHEQKIITTLERSIPKRQEGFQLRYGKKVIEVCPAIPLGKDKVVHRIINRVSAKMPLALYAGDDKTDEDAFRALREHDISIHVGPADSGSIAKYYLNNPGELWGFLAKIQSRLEGKGA